MKKALIALVILTGAAMAGTTPKWNFTDNGNGTATYSVTLNGNYNIDLGAAAITNGESFTMTVECTAPSWGNEWGTGLVGTENPYSADGKKYDDAFVVYVGRKTNNPKLIYALNDSRYEQKVDYTEASQNPSAESPLTLGMTFTYVNSKDAGLADGAAESNDGGNYFTISSTADSDVAFSFTEYDIQASFNFATLTNYGVTSGAGGGSVVGMPDSAVTTISITKAYTAPAAPAVPEPTTATLSLLALAGLAARRRRK